MDMHRRGRLGLALVLLMAAGGLIGCASPQGAYGARTFVRVNDIHGLPTYTASGRADDWLLDAEKQARQVMIAACPDGDPHLVDGMGGMTFENWSDRA
jgi:hypothetical protein